MCATCGCEGKVHDQHEHAHVHGHDHTHEHGHAHDHDHARTISLEERILARNDETAARNRSAFGSLGIAAFNLLSSPGSGKTTLLERTIRELGARRPSLPVAVIEGDQESDEDARRIREAGCEAIQINTGTGCHLDARMVERSLPDLATFASTPRLGRGLLFIENVGNLVCPALFDLGERAKVLILSVTEGEDKPLKYPHMFRAANLLLLNKVDLLPYVRFDLARFRSCVRQVNRDVDIVEISATEGTGLSAWYDWLAKAAEESHSRHGAR